MSTLKQGSCENSLWQTLSITFSYIHLAANTLATMWIYSLLQVPFTSVFSIRVYCIRLHRVIQGCTKNFRIWISYFDVLLSEDAINSVVLTVSKISYT